jgi:hypothetical protein
MAGGAEGDQVVLAIVSQTASRFYLMNFDSSQRAAELAAPAVAGKNLFAEFSIGSRIDL